MTRLQFNRFLIASALCFALALLCASGLSATTFYVDTAADAGGDGTTSALTGATCAWDTIADVNAASFNAGDSILFKRGCTWREQLTVPSSGSAGSVITFGAYGEGADPIIKGSVAPSAWASGGIWRTAYAPTLDSTQATSGERNYRDVIPANQSSYTGTKIRITAKAGAGGNWVLDGASIGAMTTADDFDADPTRITWDSGSAGATVPAGGTKVSDEITFTFTKTSRYGMHSYSANRANIAYGTIVLANALYNDSDGVDDTLTKTVAYAAQSNLVYGFSKLEVYETLPANVWVATTTVSVDVGNLIFDNEDSVGTKQATLAALDSQGDFYYETATGLLFLYSEEDPATYYTAIEAAKKAYGIYVLGKSYVTIDGIDIRYVGANAISLYGIPTGTDNIIVQNCHLAYIGGSYLTGTLRYGNGVEVQSSATNIIVRYNSLDNIYDCGISAEGSIA
ncbi:MAG: right-handed parallel beta-helix repeat-containing protein, partial [Chloroflexi bacterium]|nr:right-handed parallel beta-helix repeat-containing protein [Chloroflexota bacterium]